MKKTLKKTMALTLALIMVLGVAPIGNLRDFVFGGVYANAASNSNLTFTIINEGTECKVTDCDESAQGDLTIPSIYGGLPVTSIGREAFDYCYDLKSIIIPNSVKEIETDAFSFSGITSIIVSSENEYFSNDEYGVLYNKDKTELIQYPMESKRKSFDIPDSVTSIGAGAFSYCTALASVTFPDSLTTIYDYAFCGCIGLTSVDIPDSVTSIEWGAFEECTELKSVNFVNGLTKIGGYAFFYCSSLTSVDIPDSVTEIGNSSFSCCSNLKNIYLGNSVSEIMENSLGGAIISVSSDNENFSSDEYGVLYNKDKTELIVYPNISEKSSFEVPGSVKKIKNTAFMDCTFLEKITVDASNEYFSSRDGVLFDKEKTTLIYYPLSKKDLFYEIPKGVTHIEGYAFFGNQKCACVVIPDSVSYIGEEAFFYLSASIIYMGYEEQWNSIEMSDCSLGYDGDISILFAESNLFTRITILFLKMLLKPINKLFVLFISKR